jgi:hypothetical protein
MQKGLRTIKYPNRARAERRAFAGLFSGKNRLAARLHESRFLSGRLLDGRERLDGHDFFAACRLSRRGNSFGMFCNRI